MPDGERRGPKATAAQRPVDVVFEPLNEAPLADTLRLPVDRVVEGDELIFEGPSKEQKDVRELVLRIMPQSLELDVALKVDLKSGKSWGELNAVKAE